MTALLNKIIFGGAIPAAAAPVPPPGALDNLSGMEKMRLAFKYGDLMTIIVGLSLLCGVFVFTMLFIRRWNLSRMGYFLISALTFGVRAQKPEIIFWTPFALMAGLFSVLMFFISQKHADFDSKKEPLYFLFNGFTLLSIAFPMGKPMNFYVATIALIALISSLFFVVTKKHTPHGKFTQLEADEAILNVLERKMRRKL